MQWCPAQRAAMDVVAGMPFLRLAGGEAPSPLGEQPARPGKQPTPSAGEPSASQDTTAEALFGSQLSPVTTGCQPAGPAADADAVGVAAVPMPRELLP